MVTRDMDGSRCGGLLRHGRTSRARTSRVAETYAEGFSDRFGNGIAAIANGTGSRCGAVVERQGPPIYGETRGAPLGRC